MAGYVFSMKKLMHRWCRLLLGAWVCQTACGQPQENVPPNIILFLADDMGLGDSSAYQDVTGNPAHQQVRTPHMERLARRGVRFTDAHTPASRCTTTRYSLLTGRYAWRSRLKHWVLFGTQGDPLIEEDRPTLGHLLQQAGYVTAMMGKWHLGLRYRRADGNPAAGWQDADLNQPIQDGPLDHGFDLACYFSRSHATSGPDATRPGNKPHGPEQSIGPGHIVGRHVMAATEQGKALNPHGDHAYRLSELGSRYSDLTMEFLNRHVAEPESSGRPFFLYVAFHANHAPYTPVESIDGAPVRGASRSMEGLPMDERYDFIHENDVALGRVLDWLHRTPDPRQEGRPMIHNTLLVFASDNGAEVDRMQATGPYRSHKGSVFEGGHRIPLLMAWSNGRWGDGNEQSPGRTDDRLVGLQDLYATLADTLESPLPNPMRGQKGAEDSLSFLPALVGQPRFRRSAPMFFHDHKQSQKDPAACAMRWDDPLVDEAPFPGQWKLFFDAGLVRRGDGNPFALYELRGDPMETKNRLQERALAPLVQRMLQEARSLRLSGGHRFPAQDLKSMIPLDLGNTEAWMRQPIQDGIRLVSKGHPQAWTIDIWRNASKNVASGSFAWDSQGLGIRGGGHSDRVDGGETLSMQWNRDIVLNQVALLAGAGQCGGSVRMGKKSPLAIYCLDADLDVKDQQGIMGDLGVLLAGDILQLSSERLHGVEPEGSWMLQRVVFSPLFPDK